MKLPVFPRKTTEAVTGVVSALRRRRPTEFFEVKIGQILRCSRLLVRDPGQPLTPGFTARVGELAASIGV